MDEMDRIQDYNARFLSAAIAAQKAKKGNTPELIAMECAECGDPIPEARRKAIPGCTLCVTCQAELE